MCCSIKFIYDYYISIQSLHIKLSRIAEFYMKSVCRSTSATHLLQKNLININDSILITVHISCIMNLYLQYEFFFKGKRDA